MESKRSFLKNIKNYYVNVVIFKICWFKRIFYRIVVNVIFECGEVCEKKIKIKCKNIV